MFHDIQGAAEAEDAFLCTIDILLAETLQCGINVRAYQLQLFLAHFFRRSVLARTQEQAHYDNQYADR